MLCPHCKSNFTLTELRVGRAMPQCDAKTRNGQRCPNRARHRYRYKNFCRIHQLYPPKGIHKLPGDDP
jgi:hypothetical protein